MKMSNKIKAILPVLITVSVIMLFHYTQWFFVKFYPVAANFCLFMMFFVTSFHKETIIQRFAKVIEPDIKPKALEYTRKLTYIWTGITFLNFLISLATVYMSEKVWALYNGCISYILIGLIFAIEYVVRINFKRKHDC